MEPVILQRNVQIWEEQMTDHALMDLAFVVHVRCDLFFDLRGYIF